jgi:Flp pilus assembly protein TadD
MPFSRTAGLLLMIIASVMPGFAQVQPWGGGNSASHSTYSIAGTVRDEENMRTVEDVRVDLKVSTGTPLSTAFTRGNGDFEFSGLPDGEYIVEIVVPGYEPFRDTVSVFNGPVLGVPIVLHRRKSVVNKSSPGRVSVHELSVPRKARDEFQKGLSLLYSKSDYQGALTHFQHAIKYYPTYYEAYVHEGNAYFNLNDAPAAEQAMRKSVELSGGRYPDALFLLAGLLNKTDRASEAETLARQGIAIDDASWYGHYELARALFLLNRPEDAEKSANRAVDLKPDSCQVYLLLAKIHDQRHDHTALLRDLDAFLRFAPAGPGTERARKTREEVQADMQKAEAQTQSKEQLQSNDREQPKSNEQTGSSGEKQSDQPSEEDQPLFPPLPPPAQQ